MPNYQLVVKFALLYTLFCALAGLFHLSRYQAAGIMMVVHILVALWYLATRTDPECVQDELSAGDWILGVGASFFALTIFVSNLWLGIIAGMVVVGLTFVYGRHYNRSGMSDVQCHISALICQLIGPLPIMLTACLGWWNLGIIILIFLIVVGLEEIDGNHWDDEDPTEALE